MYGAMLTQFATECNGSHFLETSRENRYGLLWAVSESESPVAIVAYDQPAMSWRCLEMSMFSQASAMGSISLFTSATLSSVESVFTLAENSFRMEYP